MFEVAYAVGFDKKPDEKQRPGRFKGNYIRTYVYHNTMIGDEADQLSDADKHTSYDMIQSKNAWLCLEHPSQSRGIVGYILL